MTILAARDRQISEIRGEMTNLQIAVNALRKFLMKRLKRKILEIGLHRILVAMVINSRNVSLTIQGFPVEKKILEKKRIIFHKKKTRIY